MYIKKFVDIRLDDIGEVGGKNASLGEMISSIPAGEIAVPDGFALTASAFRDFIAYNKLKEKIEQISSTLDHHGYSNLSSVGSRLRELVSSADMPPEIGMELNNAYDYFLKTKGPAVAVRSSATAEDLAEASFAGQHDSFLNIKGHADLQRAVKDCYASFFTDRAIKYREDKGFDYRNISISVGIQEMVRSDLGASGVAFTLEPESGFPGIVHIAGVWGLGENMVQGTVIPDEFLIFKRNINSGKNAILQRKLGSKEKTMGYCGEGESGTVNRETPAALKACFVLSDGQLLSLSAAAMKLEAHYKKPMDIEWALDGLNNNMYIIQARPETAHANKADHQILSYSIRANVPPLTIGQAVGSRIVSGRARVISSVDQADQLLPGEILVTALTTPDWDPILKKAAGIITDQGGRTSHASIVARELNVPAIVGTIDATSRIAQGQLITLSCAEGSRGKVYPGEVEWTQRQVPSSELALSEQVHAQLILSDPESAFRYAMYPSFGVGLLRLEFMMSSYIGVHPLALIDFEKVTDEQERLTIGNLISRYPDRESFFIDQMREGISMIAAAFYPREVIVRMSDFKSNEYASLLGGHYFEPEEENPMLGLRGSSRYYSPLYQAGFRLECLALKAARADMGLDNIKIMLPFCRTTTEAEKVLEKMKSFGLERGVNGLEVYMMAEIPSNALLADEFLTHFDGFSIGSNDLTQLVLGADRDSPLLAEVFNEQDPAVLVMIKMIISACRRAGKKVGICGQGPSDSGTFLRELVRLGINSISFNPDALLSGIGQINTAILDTVHDKQQPTAVN